MHHGSRHVPGAADAFDEHQRGVGRQAKGGGGRGVGDLGLQAQDALWTGGPRYDKKLRTLLGEVIPLAAKRAGGIAWEYWFHFGGGSPLWVSGMAQSTAIQGLSRAASRLNHKSYLTTARRALGIFRTRPPAGVRDVMGRGRAHYLIYSFSREHVLNAFIQSLNGLHDYAVYANDRSALRLFKDGTGEARLEVPRYDTGAWSLYQPGEESDLGYHTLLRDFLRSLLRLPRPRGPMDVRSA